MCCTAYPVPGITGKDEQCQFARSGVVTSFDVKVGEGGVDFVPSYHPQTGCRIYNLRPLLCRQFFCGWRLGLGTEDDRPDKTGVIIHPDRMTNLSRAVARVTISTSETADALRAFGRELVKRDVVERLKRYEANRRMVRHRRRKDRR